MNMMSEEIGQVELDCLYFKFAQMRTANLEIDFEVGSDIDLGWISSTRVSLLYNDTLVGESELKDSYIIPDESNMVNLDLQNIEIQNMIGFKNFIQHVIPQPRDWNLQETGAPVAALEMVDNGHTLAIVINLDNMGVAEAFHSTVRRTNDEIKITFSVRNPTNVQIYFEQTHFNLQQDGHILATLEGDFFIRNLNDAQEEYTLTGEIEPDVELFGTAVLKGVGLDQDADTWYIHAVRQFEMEVNLDEVISSKH
ncbi:hypothetical protein ACHAO4_000305 [Trichoderma viride]